jgi:hypothetical protein
MKKKLTVLPVALVAGTAAAGIAAASAHPTGTTAASHDLRTSAKLTFAHSVDLGARGPSAGDITVFGGRLVGPDLKGRYQAYCVNVSRTRQECSETLITAGGQIAAQASYGQGTTALTPIVGGSGTYTGTRGDLSEQEAAGGRVVHLVLHLEQ